MAEIWGEGLAVSEAIAVGGTVIDEWTEDAEDAAQAR